jgi:hypothetical protein
MLVLLLIFSQFIGEQNHIPTTKITIIMQITRPVFLVIIIGILCFITFMHPVSGQGIRGVYNDQTFVGNIATVQMQNREMSYPVIELGGTDRLTLSFDDLEGDIKNYQYTVILCNADWTPSTLFPSDYIDGFYENRIDNYRNSFNTFVPYTHYSLTIPNDDISLKLPGNYILKVYQNYDPDDVVITRRFMISDSRVIINARVHRPQLMAYYNTAQQVSFNVVFKDLPVTDPYSELYVRVMQNGRHDISLEGLRPVFVRPGEAVYEHEEMIFPGGNEFRNFDIKSLRYQTEFIRSFNYSGGINHAELHQSESRQFSRYFSDHDINGWFLVRNAEGRDPSVDADYVMVHFTLPWDVPFDNGDVHVFGALSDWNFYDWNKMAYNYSEKAYELEVLLKQGYYNYQYVFLEHGSDMADPSMFEGNFFETENDYFIMVYHRSPGSRYDRLVGTTRVNSRDQGF